MAKKKKAAASEKPTSTDEAAPKEAGGGAPPAEPPAGGGEGGGAGGGGLPPGEGGEGGPPTLDRAIEDEMAESYVNYAMSVIVSRALPDARDGFKPSQRRVIYSMHDLNIGPNAKHRKSAVVVGHCMGRYHPHGDSAIYETLVRLAQDFSCRYPLADGQGNWGGITGDSAAAMRYTEVRMAPPAVDMLDDIDRETVEMKPNFDETHSEPTVLPSRFPNLLCNGSQGIAVGMSTSIPPHNLTEVVNALIFMIENPTMPEKQVEERILKLIPGPDFPTGGVILGSRAIREAYLTGRGTISVRGKAEIVTENDRSRIVVTELPYQVNTEMFKEKIIEAYAAERITGIDQPIDRSKDKVHVIIPVKKGEDPNVVLNQLYKYTPLQDSFSIILLALDRGRPVLFTLYRLLVAFKEHRFEVVRRRTIFLRKKAKEKLHLLEGLRKALDKIDAVVKTIRTSPDTETAREGLKKLLEVTDRQAQHILDMRLARLTALEGKKIDDEIGALRAEIADYDDILRKPERIYAIVVEELKDLRARYLDHLASLHRMAKKKRKGRDDDGDGGAGGALDTDQRRTQIQAAEADDIDLEDLIPDEQVVVTLTQSNYVKRSPIDTYTAQKRGGKGIYGAASKDTGDFVKQMFTASTHDYCLAFTNQGRCFWLKVYRIPEMARTARGKALPNLINLLPNETVTSVLPIKGDFDDKREVVFATAMGVIKKTNLSLFKNPMKKGVNAVKLDEGDQLIGVRLTDQNRELMLATKSGQAIRFHESAVRSMGRTARGVRGMTLEGDDRVCSLVVVGEDGPSVLTVCERGYGKRTAVDDYRVTNRGGKGIINIRTTERNGLVVDVVAVKPDEEIILIAKDGKLIRTKVSDISEIGRATQGVRLIRLGEGDDDKVVAIAKVVKGEEAGEAATPLNEGAPEPEAPEPEPEGDDEPPADDE